MLKQNPKVAIIGAGSWATAIAKMLLYNVDELHWWIRSKDVADSIQKQGRNPRYLSSVHFDQTKIVVHDDLKQVLELADIIFVAVPSAYIHTTFENVGAKGMEDKIIFSCVKGIIPEYHAIPARYFHKEFETPYDNIGIVCGPCHAEEVALEKLSYITVACADQEIAQQTADLLATPFVKTNLSDDLFGTELSAILKNVYALAAGICHGLRYGDNFQAVLMANAIRETERFVDAVNNVHRDVKSSAYLGDLLVTAYSQFSRNRTFGSMIGQGYSVKSAQVELNMVAEGYYAVKSVMEINKKFLVDIPIVEAVYNILYEKISPAIEIRLLADKLS
tara:strand:+ start:100931 stop:101932 length:1002 start_codon:yes stop_codon:yes gene_type:complete